MSWSFQALLGKIRQCNMMDWFQWVWLCCFVVQSVMQPSYGADGIAPRCQIPLGAALAKGREQVPSLRHERSRWRLAVPSVKVSNGSTEIRSPVQWLFQLSSPGSTCDHPVPWHGWLCLAVGLPLLLSGAEGYRGMGQPAALSSSSSSSPRCCLWKTR